MTIDDPTIEAIAEALVTGDDKAFGQLPAEMQDRLRTKAARIKEALTATPPPPEPARDVIEALAAVRADLPGIGKNQEMNDGGQRWSYRGIEDMTAVLGPLFGKHHLVFVPELLSAEPHEYQTRSGANWIEWRCLIKYRIYGPGGVEDSIAAGPVFTLARDASDKGIQKAMTSAYKQVLLQTFCVGDSEDDIDKKNPANDADEAPQDHPRSRTRRSEDPKDKNARASGWDDAAQYKEHMERLRPAVEALTADEREALRVWVADSGAPNPPVTKDQWQAMYDKAIVLATATWTDPPKDTDVDGGATLPLDGADPAGGADAVEVTERAIAEVQALRTDEVDVALTERGLGTDGNVATRRHRLAKALVRERASTTHPAPAADGAQ